MYLHGKQGILQKIAFEVRYNFGFMYLDKCGKTLNRVLRDHPEWMMKGDSANPQGTGLVNIDNGCSFSFSAYNYVFGLEMPAGGEALTDNDLRVFIDQTEMLSTIVNDSLGLEDFTRIGLRTWHLFEFDSTIEATKWHANLGIYTLSGDLTNTFEATIEAASIAILLSSKERQYRLSLSSVERQAQLDLGEEILNVRASKLSKDQDKFLRRQLEAKRRIHANPLFAAMVDIDAFQEQPISVDPRDFITNSMTQCAESLTKLEAGIRA